VCGRPIQFEEEEAGNLVTCPRPDCGQQTRLALPSLRNAPAIPGTSLIECPDCRRDISRRALMCPHCGSTSGVRFRLVWDVMCHIALAALIFYILGLILGVMFDAAVNALTS
jgi:DNA-directed RNA polymerase subunit RPC12/RpoP